MTTKVVYQTLEDRETDLDELELGGPYPCKWANSWLGDGFYFWDTFIENAHWWGKDGRKYTSGYIICKAVCNYNDTVCCDLVGNTLHLEMFIKAYRVMKMREIANSSTTVKRLITYLIEEVKTFKFDAIRAVGLHSKSPHSEHNFSLPFEIDHEGKAKKAYLDFIPPIQICFYSKTALHLRNYQIVFPEEYVSGYLA